MTISFIAAVSENNVIGKDNRLPWRLPTDMKYFKNVTWGMPVIMGRKSFEALGKRLNGRKNIVITRNRNWTADGVEVAQSIDEAIALAATADVNEVFITGGGEIFRATLPIANRIYLTRVHGTFEGDSFFPDFQGTEWAIVSDFECAPDEKNAYALSFQVWERRLRSTGESAHSSRMTDRA